MNNYNSMIEHRTITLPESGKQIKIRPILIKEEKILLMADESPKDIIKFDAIWQIVENCTMGNVDLKSLSYSDFSYIFVQLRMISRGESIKLDLSCGKDDCNGVMSKEFSISEILTVDGKDQKPYVELKNGFGVALMPTTVEYSRNILVRQETDKSLENKAIAMIDMICNHVTAILQGEERIPIVPGSQEAIDFIDSLTSTQLEKIAEWYSNIKTPTLKVAWTCDKCQHKNNISQSDLIHFFAL